MKKESYLFVMVKRWVSFYKANWSAADRSVFGKLFVDCFAKGLFRTRQVGATVNVFVKEGSN